MTRNGHTARIVVCPTCGQREVLYLPNAEVGHACPKAPVRDKWRTFVPHVIACLCGCGQRMTRDAAGLAGYLGAHRGGCGMNLDLSNEVERLTAANRTLAKWLAAFEGENERLRAELEKWRTGNLRDGKHDCSACGEAVQ